MKTEEQQALDEIETLLNQRPEYRDWFEGMKEQIDKAAGNDPVKRFETSFQMMAKHLLLLSDCNKKLKELKEQEEK